CEYGKLLSHSTAEALDILLLAITRYLVRQERFLVEGDRDVVEEQAKQRPQLIHDGQEVGLARLASRGLQSVTKPLQHRNFLLVTRDAYPRRGEGVDALTPFLLDRILRAG